MTTVLYQYQIPIPASFRINTGDGRHGSTEVAGVSGRHVAGDRGLDAMVPGVALAAS
jgi:hypothetical protein